MDIRRPIILIGLAICTYMLILAWNDDYASKPQDSQPIAATPSMQDAPLTSTAQSADSDAPAVETSNATAEPAQQASGQLNEVKTDVVDLTIDPLGGEVVEVWLPAYPASIEQKDGPFVLLESNERRS